jgi:hypothetical protein
MKRTPGGHYSVGALPSSYQVTPGRPWRQSGDTMREGQPPGDQTRESQPEAVKDNPPRAPTMQRRASVSLNCRAEVNVPGEGVVPMQLPASAGAPGEGGEPSDRRRRSRGWVGAHDPDRGRLARKPPATGSEHNREFDRPRVSPSRGNRGQRATDSTSWENATLLLPHKRIDPSRVYAPAGRLLLPAAHTAPTTAELASTS